MRMTIRTDTSLPSDQSDEESSGTPNDPKSIRLEGRSLAGASYGATEREQTEDVRSRSTGARPDAGDEDTVVQDRRAPEGHAG